MRPLGGAYASNYASVAALFAGDPSSSEAWREAIARTGRHPRDRERIASIVAAQQERRGAPAAARDAAARLAAANSVAVVTGQQAGAFGGPLFTLLKAITAIQLARRTETEHGTPAIAVFWVDAEDHDWEEVRATTVLDADLQPRTVELAAPEGAGERPVASLRLDDRVGGTLQELEAALARTDFTGELMASLRAAYAPGSGVADAFARWLEHLLGPYGLVVFDASDAAAKPLAARVFARELETAGRTAALAADAGQRLAAAGHQPQVEPHLDAAALFHLDGGRIAVKTADAAALATQAATAPHTFSPNVLLRPIVQDTLFPTIAYVAGPSELAYLGQLRGVYEHFGVPMPIMYPRATATLVDSAAAKFLAKYDVPIEELQRRDESLLNRLLHDRLPADVEGSLKSAADSVSAAMQRVIDAMPSVDATLAGAARTTLGKMEHELKTLESKVIQAAKRRDETLRRQFTRAQAQIFPNGHPQERTLGVVFFVNRYGTALIDRLLAELPLELGKHWIIVV
jgi:bacillithiol synthase